MATNRIPDANRMTQIAIARAFRVSQPAVSQWRECPRNEDGTYELAAVIAWYCDRMVDEVERSIDSGKDSPGLERYRLARAERAELELEQMRGTLVAMDVLKSDLGMIAGIVRKAIEQVGRDYGPGAALILDEALDDAEAKIARLCEECEAEEAREAAKAKPKRRVRR